MSAGEPTGDVARPTSVTEALVADAVVRPSPPGVVRGTRTDSGASHAAKADAYRAIADLYVEHYHMLVGLSFLYVRDVQEAEEVVQDSFIKVHDGWHRLRDRKMAVSYLRQTVVHTSCSVLRRRSVAERNAPKPAPDMPSAEQGAMAQLERSELIDALRHLPDRQREVIVLRYYADLREADIAAMMGISEGAVKSHAARAMATLRARLGGQA